MYREVCFSQKMFTNQLNCLKKVKKVLKMEIEAELWAHLKWCIQFMHSFWLTEELQ